MSSIHGQWSSRWAFILAATGSAVGLGNIWGFPYKAGDNGGSAFVLVYIVCVVAIGLPVMISEIMLGRRGRQSPINTMATLAKEAGSHPIWQIIGWSGVIAGFLILSFYSVVGGWTLAYVFKGWTYTSPGNPSELFGKLAGNPVEVLAWHTVFMIMTVAVIARGVEHGIEKAVKYLMPALFILLVFLVIYAMFSGGFAAGVAFLFKPEFSKINADVILKALGQAFFSLSLGMGAIMIYGSYLPKGNSIPQCAATIVVADTAVAILAGLAVFPILFAYNMKPAESVGLVFKTLPVAFQQMPGGLFVGTLFFLLLTFAAWTSAISLLEPAVTWAIERLRWSRIRATVIIGGLVWVLGIASALSTNILSKVKIFGMGIMDFLEQVANNIMLPLGGLFISIFAGWVMAKAHSQEELDWAHGHILYTIWLLLVRFVTPLAILFVFLNASGALAWIKGWFA